MIYTNYRVRMKYDVIFEKGATSGRATVFEGKNLLKQNAQVYSSYVGLCTYISGNTKLNKAKIGRFCSIGQNVVNSYGIHPTEWVSTHPCFYSLQRQAGFTLVSVQKFDEHKFIDKDKQYHIQIGNDVWVGNDVKIMDGITIGDGAIIATGAIVTKDVEPYSIFGGVPGKLIRKRFSEKHIEFLLRFQWWKKEYQWIAQNVSSFKSISEFIKMHS